MARDRKGAQLSFELPPELLERLRGHAAVERRTVAALLRGWIEAGLAGGVVGNQGPHPNAKAATNQDVGVKDQAFAFHRQG